MFDIPFLNVEQKMSYNLEVPKWHLKLKIARNPFVYRNV